MKILFLDDMKTRHDAFRRRNIGHDVTHVHTADEAIKALDTAVYDFAHLDHDLAEEHYLTMSEGVSEERLPAAEEYSPGTGMDVVDHIVKMEPGRRPKHVVVHTFNPRGMEMVTRLRDAGVHAWWERFKP